METLSIIHPFHKDPLCPVRRWRHRIGESLPSNSCQCQVRGRQENQGPLTRGFPEDMKAEPRPGKGDERKKRSVFPGEATECAETSKQESSPTIKELREVQCSWVTAWADLNRAKAEAGNSQPTYYLKEFELHGRSVGSSKNGLERTQLIKELVFGKWIQEANWRLPKSSTGR